MESRTLITAHSGCEGTGEDVLRSVYAACEFADCAEIDVRLDTDGRLVLSHDRRSVYEGPDLEEIFCTFAEAEIAFNCDLKEPAALYPVLALADRYKLPQERLILSGSVSCDLLAADPEISRRACVYLNIEQFLKYLLFGQAKNPVEMLTDPWSQLKMLPDDTLDIHLTRCCQTALTLGAAAFNAPFSLMSSARIKAFYDCQMSLSLWTVNTEEDLTRLLAQRPKNITTLQPKLAASLRDRIQK